MKILGLVTLWLDVASSQKCSKAKSYASQFLCCSQTICSMLVFVLWLLVYFIRRWVCIKRN